MICRFLAHKKNGYALKTCRDIAEESGLSKTLVAVLSLRTTWKGVDADVVDAFAKACSVNFDRPHVHFQYLRQSKKAFLSRGTYKQKQFLKKLMRLRR